jgi:hypothetical protein
MFAAANRAASGPKPNHAAVNPQQCRHGNESSKYTKGSNVTTAQPAAKPIAKHSQNA